MVATTLSLIFLPFAAFLLLRMGDRNQRRPEWLAMGATAVSLGLSSYLLATFLNRGEISAQAQVDWFTVGEFTFRAGISVDSMSVIMGTLVSFCSLLVQVFSTGYLDRSQNYPRYFGYLSFFTSAMLGLVFADNLLTFFMCWELMGVCSYLLIGYDFDRLSANRAALKAFLVTKMGDLGLLFAVVTLYSLFGTTHFVELFLNADNPDIVGSSVLGLPAMTFVAMACLLATAGKAAQFPLHLWLPDAMEGPTPVSALIHAATMVAAGVFLLLRMFPLLTLAPSMLEAAAWLGIFTSLFAGTLALVQNDLKRILAFSTISQLGLMVTAIGAGAASAGFLHLVTHAFFKAGLFLAAGSVIHGAHVQELSKLGGLRRQMPWTFIAFLVFALALCGAPGTSGFVSKDHILAILYSRGLETGEWGLAIGAFFGSGLTAFYLFRLIFLVFFGEKKTKVHENGPVLLMPLALLAVLSLSFWYAPWFEKIMPLPLHDPFADKVTPWLAGGAAAIGVFLSAIFYLTRTLPEPDFGFVHYLSRIKVAVPVAAFAQRLGMVLSAVDDRLVDRVLVDGWGRVALRLKTIVGKFDDVVIDQLLVDGTAKLPNVGGRAVIRLQSGKVQRYLMWAIAALGVTLMAASWKLLHA